MTTPPLTPPAHWTPMYDRWRHGGWYVTNVRYVTGAVGCVSRNYPDGKWRIVCHHLPFEDQPTFRTRDEAAVAEYAYARSAEIVQRDLERLHTERQRYLDQGTDPTSDVITQYAPRIELGEEILTAHAA